MSWSSIVKLRACYVAWSSKFFPWIIHKDPWCNFQRNIPKTRTPRMNELIRAGKKKLSGEAKRSEASKNSFSWLFIFIVDEERNQRWKKAFDWLANTILVNKSINYVFPNVTNWKTQSRTWITTRRQDNMISVSWCCLTKTFRMQLSLLFLRYQSIISKNSITEHINCVVRYFLSV